MYALLAAVRTHFRCVESPSTGSSKKSGHSKNPSVWLVTVQSLRFGDVKKWIVWTLPANSTYSVITHCLLGSCQITFGSRFPPVICFTIGLPRYLVNVRPSVLYARHWVVGFPAAV